MGAPAQGLPGKRWIGHGDGGIPMPARHDWVVNRAPVGLFKGLHHIQHGMPLAAYEVERGPLRVIDLQLLAGSDGDLADQRLRVGGSSCGFSPREPLGWAPTGLEQRNRETLQPGSLADR